ncbi:FUSC family protein [uncultured Agrococcus sp.]|uniref:FUSC family protein n=1 Tax=uncultured Agrococcus sp. TaxID=382258 RepID=UPI0025F0B57A|nr:FUSC family protein [uncultured Agrococcus sp.]
MAAARFTARVRGTVDLVRAKSRVSVLQMVKTGVAAVLAWLVTSLISAPEPPIFAVIAAIIVVQPSVNQSFAKAIERSFGVVLGVVIAMLLGLAFPEQNWVILIAVVAALVIAWLLRLSSVTSNQVPISAMLVLALGAASVEYSFERIIETVIGAGIAFVVNALVVPPVPLREARASITELAEETARGFDRLADAAVGAKRAEHPELLLIEARLLRPMLERASEHVTAAEEGLDLNPRARRYRKRIDAMRETLRALSVITTPLIGMTRAFHDHYDDELTREPMMVEIAVEMRRIAHDIRMKFVTPHEAGAEEAADTKPLLTTPLVMQAPSGTHWILIGSLLEDLRRVHEVVEAGQVDWEGRP